MFKSERWMKSINLLGEAVSGGGIWGEYSKKRGYVKIGINSYVYCYFLPFKIIITIIFYFKIITYQYISKLSL